jgi:hypothetical protein
VLKGALKFLAKFHPHIYIEALLPDAREWIANTLASIGYRKVCAFNPDNLLYSFEGRMRETAHLAGKCVQTADIIASRGKRWRKNN